MKRTLNTSSLLNKKSRNLLTQSSINWMKLNKCSFKEHLSMTLKPNLKKFTTIPYWLTPEWCLNKKSRLKNTENISKKWFIISPPLSIFVHKMSRMKNACINYLQNTFLKSSESPNIQKLESPFTDRSDLPFKEPWSISNFTKRETQLIIKQKINLSSQNTHNFSLNFSRFVTQELLHQSH